MKKLIFSILALLPIMVNAQNRQFSIKGNVGEFNAPATAYLQYAIDGNRILDSVLLKNGGFDFKGMVSEVPVSGTIVLNINGDGMRKSRDMVQFFIEEGTIVINTKDQTIASATVQGTTTNMDYMAYKQAAKGFNDASASFNKKVQSTSEAERSSAEFKKEVEVEQKRLASMSLELNKNFVKSHPNSYLSLEITKSLTYSSEYPELSALFQSLSPKVRNTESGQKFSTLLDKMKNVAFGAVAPEIVMPDTSGNLVKLSSFRGRYVLVDLWASWCGPCRAENPNLVKTFNAFKDRGFTIFGVSLDRPDAKKEWIKAIKADDLTWTQVSDLKFFNCEAAVAYGVTSIPQNFLLDPSGKVVAKNLRGANLDKKLEEIFSQQKIEKSK